MSDEPLTATGLQKARSMGIAVLYPHPQNPSEVYSNLLYRWVDVMYGEKALEKEALKNLLEYEPTYRAYMRLTGKMR